MLVMVWQPQVESGYISVGKFSYQIIPGIKTINEVADDVNQERLILLGDEIVKLISVAFINSKALGAIMLVVISYHRKK